MSVTTHIHKYIIVYIRFDLYNITHHFIYYVVHKVIPKRLNIRNEITVSINSKTVFFWAKI